jgi:hypothetical protein
MIAIDPLDRGRREEKRPLSVGYGSCNSYRPKVDTAFENTDLYIHYCIKSPN